MSKDQAIQTGVIHNSISGGTSIVGTVNAENDFRVDGFIDGKIICKGKVVIGKSGRIHGEMDCDNAEIVGKFEGTLKASQVLTLRSTAVVKGDIQVSTLVIEPNAVFNGNCTMTAAPAAPAAGK